MTAWTPAGADLARLRTLDGRKWSRYPDDVLPVWVADMDIEPPPFAADAIRRVVDRGDLGYNLDAVWAVPEAFSEWQHAAHGWRPDPGDVFRFDDVLHAIEYTIWFTTEPGDGIVLFTPIYPPFIAAVEASGRRIVDCPLDETTWRLDPERLADVIDDTTRVVLWCNPHNPTGRVFDDEELAAVAAVAAEHDLVVISDEVWGDLVHPGATHRPAAMVPGLAERTVTVSSASKSFNLAGLRCAVAHVGHEGVRRIYDGHPPHLRGSVNTLAGEATIACWREGRSWLDGLKAHLVDQRTHLATRLAADLPEVAWSPPEATYLAWLDFRGFGFDVEPSDRLFRQGRVALNPGLDFGARGAGFARLNTATSREILDEAVDRMVAACR